MCRLPLDLMTRIIELVRVPLPWAGDRDVIWDDLRQPGLATLMRVSRMTYFIAAPLLYKKLAINNLASFFLGVDDDIQPHHHGCSDPQSKQARICKWVIKKDGIPYQCHRHPVNTLITPTVNESPPSKPEIFHKQQLLQLVEEVHFVYATADRYILGQVEIEDYIDEDGNLNKEIIQHVDIGRYLNVPECIESGSIGDVLPNLKRMTVAGWLSRKYNTNSIANSIPSHVRSAGPLLHQFEQHLAQTLYQFTPTFICHYPSSGFLRQYPSYTKRICVNIVHEAEPVTFGTYLRPGADNFVHFDDLFKSSPFEMFVESIDVIADELVETMNRWHESNDEASSRIRYTGVTFVIARPENQEILEMTDQEKEESAEAMEQLKEAFRVELKDFGKYLGDWTDDTWDIVWAEREPPCPACAYEWTDQEVCDIYLYGPTPSGSFNASETSSP